MLYALLRRHNVTPPDFHLQLVHDPQLWFEFVATVLLAELRRRDPHPREGFKELPIENCLRLLG